MSTEHYAGAKLIRFMFPEAVEQFTGGRAGQLVSTAAAGRWRCRRDFWMSSARERREIISSGTTGTLRSRLVQTQTTEFYSGSQLNKVSDVSSGMNPFARAGAAIAAIDSGVQPSALWMIRIGRGELNR